MLSLLLRNLIFTILQPGIVVGLIPYLIAKDIFHYFLHSRFGLLQYMGIAFFSFGIIITLYCILEFASKGFGTLSPADPTRKLVMTGLYKYSRNPMYIGVLLCLIGEVLFAESLYLLIYSAAVFIVFYLFVVTREEPRLLKDFGSAYQEYKRKVRRWL